MVPRPAGPVAAQVVRKRTGFPFQVKSRNLTDGVGLYFRHRLRIAGAGLWGGDEPQRPGRERRQRADAGDFGRGPARRQRLSEPAIPHDRDRRRGDPDNPVDHARLLGRARLSDRGRAFGRGRLCRDERVGARKCAHGPGRPRRARRRARHRVQGGSRHRHAGRRSRAARRRRLLLHPALHPAGRRSAPRARSDGRARLRRVADLDLRASRRRHLHQGRRCRRRSRRQGRGRHPRGRSAQPGRHRRQCRR